jgi:hypothetical protein
MLKYMQGFVFRRFYDCILSIAEFQIVLVKLMKILQ